MIEDQGKVPERPWLAQRQSDVAQLRCAGCRHVARVRRDAREFRCRSCSGHNAFYGCEHCDGTTTVISAPGVAPTRWTCTKCQQTTSMPRFGIAPVRTAADAEQTLLGLGEPVEPDGSVELDGFVVAFSDRISLPVGHECVVRMSRDELGLRVLDAVGTEVEFAYDDIEVLEIGGRDRSAGGSGDCVLRVLAAGQTFVVENPHRSRDELRKLFSEQLARWENLQGAQPVSDAPAAPTFDGRMDQLERLIELHRSGVISDEEFEAIRAPLIRALSSRVL